MGAKVKYDDRRRRIITQASVVCCCVDRTFPYEYSKSNPTARLQILLHPYPIFNISNNNIYNYNSYAT